MAIGTLLEVNIDESRRCLLVRLFAQATKAESECYDTLLELFGAIYAVLDDLSLYKDCPQAMNRVLQTITVAVLAHLTDVLALALKFTKDDVHGLDRLFTTSAQRSSEIPKFCNISPS